MNYKADEKKGVTVSIVLTPALFRYVKKVMAETGNTRSEVIRDIINEHRIKYI
jgi:metal-responsive CopG/Arc/MetJ family transcriptional regulator